MARARTAFRMLGMLGATALVAAGCGGGDEVVDPGASATPGATTPGATVADPNAPATGTTPTTGAIDPVTGLPVDPAASAGGGATATIPDLAGDDVAGGLSPVSGTAVFDAQAGATTDTVDPGAPLPSGLPGSTIPGPPITETKATVTYTGAKVYVNGIVHSVNRNGTFPKGNPVFRLLSVNESHMEIELVAGEFTTNGGDGTFLDKGDLVSIVNASEQVTYRIKYLRPIKSTSDVGF